MLDRPGIEGELAVARAAERPSASLRGPVIANVQVLRALAALFVIFVHCEAAANALDVPVRVREAFSSGVDLFFVISGFIMVYTTRGRAPSAGAFMLNRIVRVVPIYWLLTLLVFALALFAPSAFQGTQADSGALLKSLLFIPFERADGSMRPILFVGWTLNYEMMFYLIFAASLALRASPTTRVMVATAAIAALAAAGFLFQPTAAEARFVTSPVVMEFAIGMLIALAAPRLWSSNALLVGAVATLGALSLVLLAGLQLVWTVPLLATALPAAGAVAAAVFLEQSGRRIGWRPLLALGDASYSLYLIHPFFAAGLALVFRRLLELETGTALLLVVLTYAASIAAALLFHRAVELPLTHYLRQAGGRRRTAPA